MKPAPLPDHESERLASLRALRILDTAAEADFDSLVRLAADLAEVPIGLVSLVDAERQWFKARVGLGAAETPRDVSFCGHVVAADAPLLVEDAHADPRFADNPLVVGEPGVRFYAGFPVRSREGRPLGTLCVIDRAPRRLEPGRLALLEALARQVSLLLELRRDRIDLAERSAAAAALERFFEVSLDLFCTADSTGHFRALNPAWERTLGFTADELRARPFVELVHPEDRERTAREAGALYEERDVTVDFENRYIRRGGGHVTLRWSARRAGELVYATARDVTAERDRERALAESEGRLRAVLDGMAEGVVVQVAGGAIIDANPAAEGILGLSRAQLEGRTSLDPRWRAVREDGSDFPGQDHPAMVALRTGEPVTGALMGVHKPSGEVTWIRINSRPLRSEGEAAPHTVVTTFRDVTEERLAAERSRQLSQQERLVTTGTLAAGVGHEINNPLTYVLGNLEVAMEELRALGSGSPSGRLLELVSTLDDARAGAERIRRIVRGLRALGRDDGPPVPTDVRAAVDLAVNMAMHELRQTATVRVELGDVPLALADESRLTQVFVNLLVNAAQAFPERNPSRNRVTVSAHRDRGTVVIAVADNGPGIAADVLPRIYDPFFTTKPVGVGTGLGLAISHSIVSALAGELLCESTPGVGTTFSVRLPIARGGSLIPSELSAGSALARPRVLVVDDEPDVVRSLARMLRAEHDVTGISDPREVIHRVAGGERWDVILCDLMMPYHTGPELYAAVSAIDAELGPRFVFVTGGVLREEVNTALANLPNAMLAKPVELATLREAVRRARRG